ncbi:MAG TPA: 2-oxoacid:ferredoxin oxidoreductase subunit beta [Candidatus Angelobacter sp.]|nr:2-oxoacid:ferredoxin oxidoreductase subunit beta [Candidatus Angelobacter sp.]
MSTTTSTPAPSPSPAPKTNHAGLTVVDYRGGKTTLCAGCGHNAITERIIDALYEMGIQPENLAKLSGIGCSSKSPAYFASRAHGFNSVHGRMPSVATGAVLANTKLLALGVTGDGDTASIGIGQFVHLMRRNLPIVYVIEDNGVYGLTKGQFSATADAGAVLKNGVVNDLPAIDTCLLSIQLGATFVARSFSGDKKQLLTVLKAALSHRGTAMIDVISPCVTFNDHDGSTKSYKYFKDHEEPLNEIGFVPYFENIEVDYDPGTTTSVRMHDGSELRLTKLGRDYDATDRVTAMKLLAETHAKGETLTGVFYVNTKAPSFVDLLNLTDEPLAKLPEKIVRPTKVALDEIMESLR